MGEPKWQVSTYIFFKTNCNWPFIVNENGKLPRGVRKIELYLSLREHHATDKLKKYFEAERYSKEYLSEIVSNLSKR